MLVFVSVSSTSDVEWTISDDDPDDDDDDDGPNGSLLVPLPASVST